jgi:hypothetical protein
MPFDRSAETRRKTLARGTIEVPEGVYEKLVAVAKGGKEAAASGRR